ncbi:MAG: type II toxin-antitoxin system PemK/MazF family toxin [Parachlamydiaceae bacterium]|nr:type II toxin-antitoxin system PemK/MazF family toxin [Parachlamydiaceae bacterium]
MSGDSPRRGEIYWADLDPVVGAETQKTRPGIIVSNDIGNEVSTVVMFAPITSKVKYIYPFEVKIPLNGKPAKIMLNQCRAIDKSRLGRKIGFIDHTGMRFVEDAIRIVFAL